MKTCLFGTTMLAVTAMLLPHTAQATAIGTLTTVLGTDDVFLSGNLGSATKAYTSDSAGTIVAGGNVYLSNFSVNTGNSGASDGLVVGGNLTMTGGSAAGKNFYVGGTTTLNSGATLNGNLQTQTLVDGGTITGNVTVAKNLTLQNGYVGGNGTIGGNLTITNGSFTNGNATVTYGGSESITASWEVPKNTAHSSQAVTLSSPVAIASTYAQLAQASAILAAAKTTAGDNVSLPSVKTGPTLSLTGTNTSLDVFAIQASQLNSITDFSISVPKNATVVVDVLGSSAVSWSGGFSLSGTTASDVLLNFEDTTSITLSNIGILGSILAPNAAITGNGGQIDGSVVAMSMSGSMEFDPPGHFGGNISAVPLPTSLPMFAGALAALGGVAYRRRAKRAFC